MIKGFAAPAPSRTCHERFMCSDIKGHRLPLPTVLVITAEMYPSLIFVLVFLPPIGRIWLHVAIQLYAYAVMILLLDAFFVVFVAIARGMFLYTCDPPCIHGSCSIASSDTETSSFCQ